jgi:hypothetical protein
MDAKAGPRLREEMFDDPQIAQMTQIEKLQGLCDSTACPVNSFNLRMIRRCPRPGA